MHETKILKHVFDFKVFINKKFGRIRTVEIDGETWLVGKDVEDVLRYIHPAYVIHRCVDAKNKMIVNLRTPEGIVEETVINEYGLYSLGSEVQLHYTSEFLWWVTSEILHPIRQNDVEDHDEDEMTPVETIVKSLIALQQIIKNRNEKVLQLAAENAILKQVLSSEQSDKHYI